MRSTFPLKQAAEFPYSETFYFTLLPGTEFVAKGEEEPLPVCKGSIAAFLTVRDPIRRGELSDLGISFIFLAGTEFVAKGEEEPLPV